MPTLNPQRKKSKELSAVYSAREEVNKSKKLPSAYTKPKAAKKIFRQISNINVPEEIVVDWSSSSDENKDGEIHESLNRKHLPGIRNYCIYLDS